MLAEFKFKTALLVETPQNYTAVEMSYTILTFEIVEFFDTEDVLVAASDSQECSV